MKAARARDGGRIEIPFRAAIPYAIPFVLAGAALLATAPGIWLVLLTDGFWPVATLVSAAGWGAWPARWMRSGGWSVGQELSLAIALGLGVVGGAALGLGVAGLLGFASAVGLLAIGGVLGFVRLAASSRRRDVRGAQRHADPDGRDAAFGKDAATAGRLCRHGTHGTARHLLLASLALLPLCVPLYIMAFGACLPPGVLWPEEANGYDVLEYHLQGPREWFERGRVEFLPHNVYTSFPQQTEILYLLLMHLCRDAHAAAIPSQLLHAALGLLTVFAIGAWLPPGWPRISGVAIAGTTPWIAYLGCLAYVENALLFFTAVSAGIVLTWFRDASAVTRSSALAAGLCAGLAGACKYTGLVFVAAAPFLACALTLPLAFRAGSIRRFLAPIAACYVLGATLGVGPWLARNAMFTGNPVYPFAFEILGGRGWSAEQAEQWRRGHAPAAADATIAGRLSRALSELIRGSAGGESAAVGRSYFGALPAMAVAALIFGVGRPRLEALAFLGVWVIVLFCSWTFLTYIPASFAVPLVVPLTWCMAMQCGRAAERYRSDAKRVILRGVDVIGRMAVVALTVAVGVTVLVSSYRFAITGWSRRTSIPVADMLGRTDAFIANHPLNIVLPKDAHAWLVGDAAVFYLDRRVTYHTVFNRDPWLEFSRDQDAKSAVDWLRARGVTHVVFNWPEIERLRKTYGFSGQVTPEWVTQLQRVGLAAMPIPADAADALRGMQILVVK